MAAQRLADSVVDQIRALIVQAGLEAGSRLPSERELAARVGTSRAIVAQALRTLSLMGLVEIRPGSGAYVTRNPASMLSASVGLLLEVQPASAGDLARFRFALERMAVAEAAAQPGDGLEEVGTALERMRASAGVTSAWVVADTMFHTAVVRMAGNPYLTAVFEAVHSSVLSVGYEAWVQREQVPRWLRGGSAAAQIALHVPIAEALRRGDPDAAARAVAHHQQELLRHLAQRGPSGGAPRRLSRPESLGRYVAGAMNGDRRYLHQHFRFIQRTEIASNIA